MGSRRASGLFALFASVCVVATVFWASGGLGVSLTRPIVKIGLVAPFEGQYRYVGYDAFNAARLALREANAVGSLGVSVELVAFDDQGAEDMARIAARNLAQDPQVVAVIGHYLDDSTHAAESIYDEAEIPLIVAGTVAGSIFDPDFEALCPLLGHLADAIEKEDEQTARPLAFQWLVDPSPSLSLPECFQEYTVVTSTELPPASGADAVLLTGDPISAGETLLALREAGWQGMAAGGPALASPLFRTIAQNPQGVMFVTSSRFPDIDDTEYSERYRSLGPHVSQPGPFALTTHRATRAVLDAIQQAEGKGESASRNTVGQYLDLGPQETYYIYRWTGEGTAQLISAGNVLDAN